MIPPILFCSIIFVGLLFISVLYWLERNMESEKIKMFKRWKKMTSEKNNETGWFD